MADDWTTTIAAERMELDREFNEKVQASSFNRQQWGLVMTALEFEIENASNPDEARMVANTSNLSAIMPELDKVGQQGPMAGGGGGSAGGSGGGGLVDSVKGALGLGGGGGDDERLEEATDMGNQYAARLQETLEAKGRWESVRKRAAE